jgi:hypothetical protein
MGALEKICPDCKGEGKVTCEYCQGEGGKWVTYGGETTWYPCSYGCIDGKKICMTCNGWGKVTVYE